MNHQQKVQFLEALGTRDLLEKITAQAELLEKLLKDDAKYRFENVGYLANYGSDCQEVQSIIAGLLLDPPVAPETGKKATVAQTENWAKSLRTTHDPLKKAIQEQNRVTFQTETNRIEIDMARKRFESLRGILALRTAQITYLSNGE